MHSCKLLAGLFLVLFFSPLIYCRQFQLSTFFYHYVLSGDKCNDTIALEGVKFLGRDPSFISESTAVNQTNQTQSGACMEHFQIGSQSALGEFENPVVTEIPDESMGMYVEITYMNRDAMANYTIVINLTALVNDSYTTPMRYSDKDEQFSLDISFRKSFADDITGNNCGGGVPMTSSANTAVIVLSVFLALLIIIVVVVAVIVMCKVRVMMANREDCRPKFFNRYFIDPRESRHENEDIESSNGSSLRSRLHTRLTLINGSLYFWKSPGNNRKKKGKTSSKQQGVLDNQDTHYENDYQAVAADKKPPGPSVRKKEHLYEDFEVEDVLDESRKGYEDHNTNDNIYEEHEVNGVALATSKHHIYEDHEADGSILAISHISSRAAGTSQTQAETVNEEVKNTDPEDEISQDKRKTEKSDEPSVKPAKSGKKSKMNKQAKVDKKQKKKSKDNGESKDSKKKEKAKKNSSKDDSEEGTVVKNLGAVDETVTQNELSRETEEHEKQKTSSATVEVLKSKETSGTTSSTENTPAELVENSKRRSVVAELTESPQPKTDEEKPKLSVDMQNLIGGLDGPISPNKQGNRFSYLSGVSSMAEISEESTAIEENSPHKTTAAAAVEPETRKPNLGKKIKANISRVFGSRESAILNELEKSTDKSTKQESLTKEEDKATLSKKVQKIEKKLSSVVLQLKERNGSDSTESGQHQVEGEVEGKDGYVDISTIARRKTEKRADSPDDDDDGYIKTKLPLLPLQAGKDDVKMKMNMAYAAEKFGGAEAPLAKQPASTPGDYDYVSDKTFAKFRRVN